MSESKKGKALKYTIGLPVTIAINSDLVKGVKNLKDSGSSLKDVLKGRVNHIVCPFCTHGELNLYQVLEGEDEREDGFNAIWSCSHCDNGVATATADKRDLAEVVKENAAIWYAQENNNHERSQHILDRVKVEVRISNILYTISSLFFLYSFYIIAVSNSILTKINTLGILTILVLTAFGFAFRAWVLFNDYLYQDRKPMMKYWVKQGKIFGYPLDDENNYILLSKSKHSFNSIEKNHDSEE